MISWRLTVHAIVMISKKIPWVKSIARENDPLVDRRGMLDNLASV